MQNFCRPTDVQSEEQCHQDKQAAVISTCKCTAVTTFKQMFRQYVVSCSVMCLLHSVQTYMVTACFEWRFRVLIHQVLRTAQGDGMKLEPRQKENQKNSWDNCLSETKTMVPLNTGEHKPTASFP